MLQFSLTGGLGQTQLPSSFTSKMSQVRAGSDVRAAIQAQVKADPLAALTSRLATSIMLKVRRLPEEKRLEFLKGTLDSIDTGLWSVVDKTAQGYIAAGEDPSVAYLAALTQKLSVAVLVKLAQAGQTTQPLQGLGETPAPGTCTVDQKQIWDAGGFWRRLKAGESCVTVGTQQIATRTDWHGGISGQAKAVSLPMIKIGPFSFPVTDSTSKWIYDSYDLLTADQAAYLREVLKKPEFIKASELNPEVYANRAGYGGGPGNEYGPGLQSVYQFKDGGTVESTWPAGDWLTRQGWIRAIGIQEGESFFLPTYSNFNRNASAPIARFKHPKTGQEWGLWIDVSGVGPDVTAISTTTNGAASTPTTTKSMALRFMAAKLPDGPSWWDRLKGKIKGVVAEFYELVSEVGEEIGDLLCTIANNPGPAVTAGTSMGGPGVGAAVGAGSLLLSEKCQAPPPPEEPKQEQEQKVEEPKKFPWGPVIAGSIAAVGAVAFVLKGRKSPTT